MTVADHEVVGEVGFAAWSSSTAFEESYLDPDVIARVKQDFYAFPSASGADIHIAELNGELVGWGARENAPDYVSDLWVHPHHQGKGVGGALLLHLCKVMASEGLQRARLDTHAKNVGAIRLYERCGFRIVWRGLEYSKSMGVDLEKVHLEKEFIR